MRYFTRVVRDLALRTLAAFTASLQFFSPGSGGPTAGPGRSPSCVAVWRCFHVVVHLAANPADMRAAVANAAERWQNRHTERRLDEPGKRLLRPVGHRTEFDVGQMRSSPSTSSSARRVSAVAVASVFAGAQVEAEAWKHVPAGIVHEGISRLCDPRCLTTYEAH
jgi:hypothetical protein